VQRAIETRGIPTVSIIVALDATEHIKPPRAVFLPFMMGHHFGVPFHKELQHRIIMEALEFLSTAQESGEIKMLPIKWAQARQAGKLIEKQLKLKS
jgi:hypothetical protein